MQRGRHAIDGQESRSEDGSGFVVAEDLSMRTTRGPVYDKVSMYVPRQSVCCVFGDNGCGKTSLLLSLCGRMKADAGTGQVAGYDLQTQFRRIRRISSISFIPGINDVQFSMTVGELTAAELSLAGRRGSRKHVEEFLTQQGMLEQRLVRFSELNAYDTALFGIVLALCACPQLLIVDDVETDLTRHQSEKLVARLRALVEEHDITVLFACSEYEIARLADGIVVMGYQAAAQRRAVIEQECASCEEPPVIGTGNGIAYADIAFDAVEEMEAPRS